MPRELSKCRNWEKERRNRLNECFKKLEVLLPCYEPSTNLSKPDILKKAAEYINELKEKVEKCLTDDPEKKPEHEEIKQLYVCVKQFVNRNDQLAKLLKDAGIPIPPASFNFKSTHPKMWSNVISPQKAAMLAKLEEQKENEPRKLVKRKCVPKKKVSPKKQFVKQKIKKGRKKINGVGAVVHNNLRPIVISGTNFNTVQNLMAVPNMQQCFFIANNVSDASAKTNVTNPATTVLSNSNIMATPVLSSSSSKAPIVFSKPTNFPTRTIILANNLPVIQPPALIPPPIILNAPPANTVILVNKANTTQPTKKPQPSSQIKTIVGSRPLQRICKKISNTTTTHVNKVPIPASRYANDYILVSKMQVAKTEVRRVKKVVKKVAIKRKNSEVVKSHTVVKKAKIIEEPVKVLECDKGKKPAATGSSDYSIDAICKDSPDETAVVKEKNLENEEDNIDNKKVEEKKSDDKIKEVLKTIEKPDEPTENITDETLVHSELSNDIFASLQVPSGGQNPESTSPTAAFLNAFPLVSSFTGVKVTEVMEEETSDSQHGTPTLLQIGTMDTAKPTHSLTDTLTPSLLNLDNFSFFSSKELYNAFDAVASEVTKVAASKEINVISKTAKILYDTAVSETNYQMMPKLSTSMVTGVSETNHYIMPKMTTSLLPSISETNHQVMPKMSSLMTTIVSDDNHKMVPKLSSSMTTTVSNANHQMMPKISSSMITDVSEANQMRKSSTSIMTTAVSETNQQIMPKMTTSTATTASTKTVTTSNVNSSTVIVNNPVPVNVINGLSFPTLVPQKNVPKVTARPNSTMFPQKLITSDAILTNDMSLPLTTTMVAQQLITSEVLKNNTSPLITTNALQKSFSSEPMLTNNMSLSLSIAAGSQKSVTTLPTFTSMSLPLTTMVPQRPVITNMCLPLTPMNPQKLGGSITNMSLPLTSTVASQNVVTTPITNRKMSLRLPIPQNIVTPVANLSSSLTTAVSTQHLVTAVSTITNTMLTSMVPQKVSTTIATFTSNMSLPLSTTVVSHHLTTAISNNMLTMPPQKIISTVPIVTSNNTYLPLTTTMVAQNLVSTFPTFTNNMSLPLTTMVPQKCVTTGPICTNNMPLPLPTAVVSQNVPVPTFTNNISLPLTTVAPQKTVTTGPIFTNISLALTTTSALSQNIVTTITTMAPQSLVTTVPTITSNMSEPTTMVPQNVVTAVPSVANNMALPLTTTAVPQKLVTAVTTQTPSLTYSVNNSYAPFYNSNNNAQGFPAVSHLTSNNTYMENKSKSEKLACSRYTSYNISEYNTFNPFTDLPKTSTVCTYTITKTYTQPTYTNNTNCSYNYQADFNTSYPVKNIAKNTHYNMNYESYDNANQYNYYNPQLNKNHSSKIKAIETTPRPPVNWMTTPDLKNQSVTDFKHQATTDFKHQATTDFKHQPTADFKHQSITDFKNQSTADFKQQSITDFKNQSATDFKHQSTTDFKHQSTADFKHQSVPDFKHQPTTDFVVPTFGKETEFVANIYTQNNFASNVQTTYFNTTAPIYSTPEFHNNFEGKKLETQFNNTFQRNDVEEHQFSWSPTKLPQLLDPAHNFVTTTLPTLVGDLALGNTQYSDKNKVKKDSNRRVSQQNYDPSTNSNFLSVSQLVDHNKPETTARVTSRRNSGGRSKATTPKNTKNRNKGENKEAIMSPTYKPIEKSVYNTNTNTIQNNQTSGEWIGNDVKRVKQPPSSYSAEALIGQNQAKQRPQAQNYSKALAVPTFFSENMLYFPPMEIQQDNNFAQQNQNYQNHSFSTTNTYSTPYLPATNYIPEITDYNPVIPDNIFSHANTAKIPENKQFNKPLEFNKPPVTNKPPPTNKPTFHNNTTPKKSKKKPNVETSTPGFVDFSFLSMPGTINSPILPDDFHAHSNFLPPPNPNQLYPCKNPLYPKQGGDLGGSLLPLPPVSRSNMQHAEISPSINNTVGTSLTNFNLSTIFPEINKSTVPEMYLDPSKHKDYGLQRTYLPTSSQLPSFSKAPIYSTITTQSFPNN